ncbi:MAG: hypothetical protein E7633_02050 [Ruminococcaceae bacterium]|nr:hypothetical protein [Oscillospiraceae bacterium]
MCIRDKTSVYSDLFGHNERLSREFENYYSTYDPDTNRLVGLLDEMAEKNSGDISYSRKADMYDILCRECKVHVFENSDLFFEMSSGRGRASWGGLQSCVGSFMHNRTADKWLGVYRREIDSDLSEGLLYAWDNPVGFDHHCPGYDKILKLGITGIISEAENEFEKCEDQRKKEFYRSVIRANKALVCLIGRFADEARKLAGLSSDKDKTEHYNRVAAAAENISLGAPKTFYEALSLIILYRECVSSVEGIGISTFGQLDRMLYPFYTADIEAGVITREKVFELFCDLLIYTEIRFKAASEYNETSTTIELGGCDRQGNAVCNELTEAVLEAVLTVRSIGTKINCRISQKHPKKFLENIASILYAGLPTLMMHNDDVLIPARVNQGQDIEDARLYVGGGCHEIVLQGSEVCTRADTWINLPAILLRTMENAEECQSYEEFEEKYLCDVKAYHERIVKLKNAGESKWCEYDPLVLFSSSIEDSLKKGLDVTEGGAKYNSTALSMLGTATFIDSLYAVKQLVFDEKRLTLPEFCKIIKNNFADNEALRQYIVKKLPKHGTNSDIMNEFSAKVLNALSKVSGQTNARGGKYLPAFYPHDIYVTLGNKIGATPDGRLAGTPLSRGVSPSEFVATESPLELINSLKSIDFTEYADSFCAELTLPVIEDMSDATKIITAVTEAFLEAEGSSLQINLLSRDVLIDAKAHPELYPNLCVRVCGYSARFSALRSDRQDEIINRMIR